MDLPILEIGNICPKCRRTQFTVISPDNDMSRPDLPPGVLGLADCRSCQEPFLVKLAPELRNAFISMFGDYPNVQKILLERLFP
jgi:hypothetical protein